MKVTEPVGAPGPAVEAEMVAVNVTAFVCIDRFADERKVVIVDARPTSCCSVSPLSAKSGSTVKVKER